MFLKFSFWFEVPVGHRLDLCNKTNFGLVGLCLCPALIQCFGSDSKF
jgi:hypothetical protein